MTAATDRSALTSSVSRVLVLATLCAVGIAVVFYDGLSFMIRQWGKPDYGHGYLIPFIAGGLILAALPRAAPPALVGAFTGTAVVALGVCIGLIGELSTLYTVIQGGMLIAIFGTVLAAIGWRGLGAAWAPALYLLFMVPLPNFLHTALSAELQLLSSTLGVEVIRMAGVPVFLEGNVIDLGSYKLQVVDACSGLRYLFPLMSFGFLVAILYRGPWPHKAILFLLTIPITIGMNSLRIAITGILVDRWGISAAEGFLHYFEGWLIFIACLALLMAAATILARFGAGSLRAAVELDISLPTRGLAVLRQSRAGGPLLGAAIVLALGVAAMAAIGTRAETPPERVPFTAFPRQVDDWLGREAPIDPEVLEALHLSDHISTDYRHGPTGDQINLYISYYDSQRKGEAVHSPRACVPAGGWEIASLSERVLTLATEDPVSGARQTRALPVNRAVIQRGDVRQVVYYWFKQRDRHLTNEYLVKWFIFWDGLTRGRTDGAMIRLVAPVARTASIEEADARLTAIIGRIHVLLERHIPD